MTTDDLQKGMLTYSSGCMSLQLLLQGGILKHVFACFGLLRQNVHLQIFKRKKVLFFFLTFLLLYLHVEQHTVGFSQSSLIHLVGPTDCTLHNYVHGGESNCFLFYFWIVGWADCLQDSWLYVLTPESCLSGTCCWEKSIMSHWAILVTLAMNEITTCNVNSVKPNSLHHSWALSHF